MVDSGRAARSVGRRGLLHPARMLLLSVLVGNLAQRDLPEDVLCVVQNVAEGAESDVILLISADGTSKHEVDRRYLIGIC